MKAIETALNTELSRTISNARPHRRSKYRKVLDQRKHPIRGLWKRGQRYYAQVTVEDPNTAAKQVRRVPLVDATTDAEAVAKLQELLTQRRKGALPPVKRTPKFTNYAIKYFEFYDKAVDAKRKSTLATEKLAIKKWKEHLGDARLNRINRAMINSYIAKRQAAGRSGRTVNLEVICFRNVMKCAIDDGWITSLPTQNLKPLKWTPRKRRRYPHGAWSPVLRTARQLSQEKLAELVDLHPRSVQKIEAGQTNILLTTVARFRKALGCGWDELMPGG